MGPADIAAGVLILGGVLLCAGSAIHDTLTAPSISLPDTKAEEKDAVIPADPPKNGTTYYHVTTPENAASIISTNTLTGSIWENGFVYAWRIKPSKYARNHSGTHLGVTISFKTNASFVPDTNIIDIAVVAYGPVVSVRPGPITVWDVKIVE